MEGMHEINELLVSFVGATGGSVHDSETLHLTHNFPILKVSTCISIPLLYVQHVILTLYMRKTPKDVINLHVLNVERRLKASWIWLSVITARGKWLQALYPVCG